ncbi:Glutaredoxin-C4 [Phytophthora nicotianae]|uniref:Glutaredoxin-C4 n=1 Tax=Phytophthora nicotianae TaxID=4792 RepID=A0A0W8CTY1_PHYNI|nr:Glutaredoxin-C4 [Phytophthora nicotianae]
MSSTLDVKLNRIDRIFHPHYITHAYSSKQEMVQGQVIISSPKGFSHQGLAMKVEGSARMQLSTKSAGLFDSFYNNVSLSSSYTSICRGCSGKVPPGITKFPFEFELQGNDGQELLETYHGVYVSVKYEIICDCIRGIMKNKLHKTLEFVVEVPLLEPLPDSPEEFHITPESLENVRRAGPYCGSLRLWQIIIEEAKSPIKSVELQLIRVESVAHAEGIARDAFKVEFETNVVVLFENGNMITENFPLLCIGRPRNQCLRVQLRSAKTW